MHSHHSKNQFAPALPGVALTCRRGPLRDYVGSYEILLRVRPVVTHGHSFYMPHTDQVQNCFWQARWFN